MGRPRTPHRWVDGLEMKRCGRCTAWFPLDQFARDSARWDGLQSTCRACFGVYSASYRERHAEELREYDRTYALVNREHKTATRLAWRRENLDRDRATQRRHADRNRETIREQDRARYWRDRDKRLAQNHAAYRADPQARIDQVAEWRRQNPERAGLNARLQRARRRAREAQLPCQPWSIEELISRDGLVCWLCGRDVGLRPEGGRRDWNIEHLIPIGADGYLNHPGDTLANVAIACDSCNKSKGVKVLLEAETRYRSNLARRDGVEM